MTTLITRLLLADLFIHGIGGAKYDLLTDEISAHFFGFKPPEFMTLSGTLRLPISHGPPDTDSPKDTTQDTTKNIAKRSHEKNSLKRKEANHISTTRNHAQSSHLQPQKIAQWIRDLTYHPESHIDWTKTTPAEQASIEKMIQKKKHWIQISKTPQNAAERHRAIVETNIALQPWLSEKRQQLEREFITAQQLEKANNLLRSREYAFCLFPKDHLRNFLLR